MRACFHLNGRTLSMARLAFQLDNSPSEADTLAMDLSKLPKLSESPPPPPAATGDAPLAHRVVHDYAKPEANSWDLGFDLLLAFLFGVIFLTLGRTFGSFLIAKLTGQPFVTGVEWAGAGAAVGKAWNDPVDYFDLQGGTAWSDMGFFVLGAAMLLEGVILGLAMFRGRAGTRTFATCMVLAGIGAIANIVAVIMVMRAGMALPLISIVAAFAGAFTAMMHARRVFEHPARA